MDAALSTISTYHRWVTKSEMATVTCVISGRLVSSRGLSAAISSKIPMNTGTITATMTTITTSARPKTTAG